MEEIEKRLELVESRVSLAEREFQNSWAHGTRSEYEDRFKDQVINRIIARVWFVIAGLIAAFGLAIAIYLDLALEKKVIAATENNVVKLTTIINRKISTIQQNESKRINDIIDGFDWRQSHDFGYIYRNLAKLFWDDKTISEEAKSRWISQVLKLATEKLKKANKKNEIKGETLWELGNLAYKLPLKYHLDSGDPEIAASYYTKAISLYKQEQISKGWRGGAYEDLSKAQSALSNLHKGTEKGRNYNSQSIDSKRLALRDYEELVSKDVNWVGRSIINLKRELKLE